MAAHTVQLPSPVNQVVFCPPPRCNDFLVLLACGRVGVFSYDVIATMEAVGAKPETKDPQGFRQLLQPPELAGLTEYVHVTCDGLD